MTILDRACWERGCPCFDPKEGEGVEVIRKEWVGLTVDEIDKFMPYCHSDHDLSEFRFFALEIEAKLKEKNT